MDFQRMAIEELEAHKVDLEDELEELEYELSKR